MHIHGSFALFLYYSFLLGIQLYDILQLFLLIILFSLLFSSLKCLFVLTDWYNGGLKNMTFLSLFRVFLHCGFLYSCMVYFSLCFKASWYIVNDLLNIFSFLDKLLIRFCIIVGKFFLII